MACEALSAPQSRMVANPDFDQVDALLSAANQMLMRAMGSSPVATKPSDVKALIDSAANARRRPQLGRSQKTAITGPTDEETLERAIKPLKKRRFLTTAPSSRA